MTTRIVQLLHRQASGLVDALMWTLADLGLAGTRRAVKAATVAIGVLYAVLMVGAVIR